MNCFYCKGSLRDGLTNHVVTMQNCIIIVRNVPCEECTQCSATFYSDAVAKQLELIVKKTQSSITEIAVVNYSDKVA